MPIRFGLPIFDHLSPVKRRVIGATRMEHWVTFSDENNPNYSKADADLMQTALDEAAARLRLKDINDPEFRTLMRFIRAAFIIGNRDATAMANFAITAVLARRPPAADSKSRPRET